MTTNLFQTAEYKAIMQEHISQTIGYLFNKNQDFALACDMQYVNFNPELPTDLKEGFNETVLFILTGYTLESAIIEEGYFSFEAGFGDNNFGSVVLVPLLAIKQILVGDNPIVFNLAHPEQKSESKRTSNISASKNSMEALLKNPENKKLLKKRK